MRARTIAVVGLMLLASTAGAAPGAGPRCQARKVAAASKALRDILKCHALGAQHGILENPACVAAAHVALTSRFAKLDATGNCLSTGDAPDIGTTADGIVVYLRFVLRRPTSPSACSAARLKATGRLMSDELHLYARDKLHPNLPLLYTADAKVRTRFFTAFATAAALGDCLPTDTFPTTNTDDTRKVVIGKLFNGCQDGVKGPGEQCDTNDATACPLACKPDCTCPFCGDNVVNQPLVEQCDGTSHAACGTAPCQANCTCPPAVCGDGAVNAASEQCDPPSDGACAGLCRADCTCPAPVCGNGIVEAGETCEPGGTNDCATYGFPCGAPDSGAPCQCCVPPGSNVQCFESCTGIPCCDGGSPQQIGPEFGICRNSTGRCDPPAVCELGNCQPDHSCCAPLDNSCLLGISGPLAYLTAAPCCGGLACREFDFSQFPHFLRVNCCVSDGAACTSDATCCTGHCTGGTCEQCRAPGAACATAAECCSPGCVNGTCGACQPSGVFCTDGVQCCSGACNPVPNSNGTCQ